MSEKIVQLNEEVIKGQLKELVSYGHDGLLNIFHCLFQKYPLLGRIIADRYDFIFIDEYQDTRAEVLSDLLTLPAAYGITIALFGDSMQSIYEDGVGDVEEYVKDLCKILYLILDYSHNHYTFKHFGV